MFCAHDCRVSRWIGLLAASVILLISVPTNASAVQPSTLPATIEARLIGQNFNVSIGKQFRFVLAIPNDQTQDQLRNDPSAFLRVEVHAAVTTRKDVRDAASGSSIPAVIETHDLPFSSLGKNESGDVVALLGSNSSGASLRLRKSGIYPVSLSIRVGDRESARLLTFINFITVQTSKNTLSVSVVAEINPPLSQLPNGEISLPDATRSTLNGMVAALSNNTAQMSLRISPETLNNLASSTQSQDAALLGQIQSVLSQHQTLASTYVSFDPSAAEEAKMSKEFIQLLQRGVDVLDLRNGDASVNPRTWFSTKTISEKGVSLLSSLGYTNIVFSPQAAQALGALDSYTKQYRAKYPNDVAKKVSLGVADPIYAASMSAITRSPVQTSMAIAAEVVAQQSELVVGQRQPLDHHLVISTFDGSLPNPVLLNTLLVALSNAPQLTVRPLSSLPRPTEANTLLSLPQGVKVDLRSRSPQIASIAQEISSTRTMLVADSNNRMWWDDSLLALNDDALNAERFDEYVKGLRAQLRGFRASVSVPQSLTFTLGGKSSNLRLQLRNSASVPLSVLVTLSSAKLSFPEKPQIVTIASNSAIDVIIPVVARANGTFPLEVVLYTPDGTAQVGKRIRLSARVSALAGLGQLATGVALLLLMSWWVAHWRKQNRTKAIENHPAVR